MPLIDEFKAALISATTIFSQKEGKLTDALSQAVLDIEHLVATIESAVTLRQAINLKLPKVPSKTFYFFPFVNDLPKEMRKVLADSQFAENQLLIADCKDMRAENRQLRKENELLREEFEVFKKSGMPQEMAVAIQAIKEENLQLKKELSQLEQTFKLVLSEKTDLEQSVITLTEEKRLIKEDLEKTKGSLNQLTKEHLQKLEEHAQIKKENERLKEELEAYKKNKATGDSKPNTQNYRPSFQFN